MVLTHVDLIDKLLAYNSFQKVRRVAAWEAARVPPRAQRQLRARSEQGLGGQQSRLPPYAPFPLRCRYPLPCLSRAPPARSELTTSRADDDPSGTFFSRRQAAAPVGAPARG